jgi:uncharacterized membrane protein
MTTDRSATRRTAPEQPAGPPKAPRLLMGIGLGGFVDGILLHQVAH